MLNTALTHFYISWFLGTYTVSLLSQSTASFISQEKKNNNIYMRNIFAILRTTEFGFKFRLNFHSNSHFMCSISSLLN